MMLSKIFQTYEKELSAFCPYAPGLARIAWQGLDGEWKKETVALGEQYLGYEYPCLSATDFMDFTRTGNRSRYEEKYFAKRQALDALVLAECVENKGRFMDDIVNGIFSLCEESAWQLPPHNTYVRDTPQLPLPDASHPVLDIFACETGAILAAVCYLLKDKLDGISPFLSKRISSELQCRIFTPYLNRHFWWMGNGKEPMNNWTIWCTQNVLLSAFLTDTDDGLRKRILHKACISADYFLAEYGDDGCCDEGAQYYRHAGLCLFQVLEILNAVTGNAFSSLYLEAKIKNIASYILNVHIEDEYYVNFADCSPIAGRAGVREFLFAKRTGNADMTRFAAADFLAGGMDSLLLPKENNLYYRLENGFHAAEIKSYALSGFSAPSNPSGLSVSSSLSSPSDLSDPSGIRHKDIYYPSVGLFIARDDTLCLAVKAGGNADSHNHNDTGSFTVYKNGKPLIIDVGVESYTKKTFSPKRYEIWTMQSAFHNLPTINGMMQADGKEYRAKDVRWRMDDSICEIEMDIATAYPPESGLTSYKRKAALHKGEGILIEDRFAFRGDAVCSTFQGDATRSNFQGNATHSDFQGDAARSAFQRNAARSDGSPSVILSLMTYEKPILLSETAGLSFQIGSLGRLRISSGQYLKTETIPITDERLMRTWKHEIYRMLIAAEGGGVEMDIR